MGGRGGRDWRLPLLFATVFLLGLAVSGLVQATLGSWLLLRYGATPVLFGLTLGLASLTGGLLSLRFLADVLIGPLAGHLSDRLGRRRLALVTGGLVSLGLLGLAWADQLPATVAAALLLSLATPALQATLDGLAGDLAPPARRAQLLSWYTNWADLGWAAGPLLGYLSGIELALLYQLGAGLLLLVGALLGLLLGERRR